MLLKVTSLIKQRPFQHSQHLGNFKSSESCEPETATKTKYTQEIHFGHLGGKSQYHQSQDQPLKKKNGMESILKIPKVSYVVRINIISINCLLHSLCVCVSIYVLDQI